ncbi:MAG: Gfo/Idh/MocA family oxidoreductase [Bacteroidetes bacterium]|nr:Gfo/Idh/MocA family oxidoreductase [Bacteroidota bacterium]
MSHPTTPLRFALIGAAGYIAPRHMKAIRDTGNTLVAALDPFDSVGIIDSYFPDAQFFIEPERFDRHLDKLRRKGSDKVDYVSICSPNYLHDAHIRMALRNQAHAICEKPLVLNPWNLDALAEIERETGKRIYTILQLRLHPAVQALRRQVQDAPPGKVFNVQLEYITSRGCWYQYSWKGNLEKSGGIATNIGVHFFDMLSWIFGEVKENVLEQHTHDRAAGRLRLEKAEVSWFLSINAETLPNEVKQQGKTTYRSLSIDDQEFEFSEGFTDLHTQSYKQILEGGGFGLDDARPSISLVHDIRVQAARLR